MPGEGQGSCAEMPGEARFLAPKRWGEKAVAPQFSSYLHRNNIHEELQSGFRPPPSSETALLRTGHDLFVSLTEVTFVPHAFETARVCHPEETFAGHLRHQQLQTEPASGLNQYGFKPAHLTETALTAVTEASEDQPPMRTSVLILLHLSAGFDRVNHKILLCFSTVTGIQQPNYLPTGSCYCSSSALHTGSTHVLAPRRVNHKILLSVLTDLGITATAWNPSKTELLFVPSTATEDVSALTLVRAASELM
ncbi:hypothetical protein NFI96_005695, partial [Prochilodus magdalenae]